MTTVFLRPAMCVTLGLAILITWFFSVGSLAEARTEIPGHIRDHAKVHNPGRVFKRFDAGNTSAYIIVNLKRPAVGPERPDLRRADNRERLRRSVRDGQERVLNRLSPDRVKISNRFEYIYSFAAEATLAGLDDLLALEDVVSVDPDEKIILHTKQGIPLMNASTVRDTWSGHGVAIAIVDSGIDYTHPKLGGGGFPNAKVVGGYDYGGSNDWPRSQDADPMDVQGHGTNCAGVAAGDMGTTGDYIGGVAHGARLYALKVTHGTGNEAYESDIVAAWEWCITHKNDDPANPILVISTSLGSDGYSSACDGEFSSMTQAAANVVSAGITLFASAGNSGYCDRLAFPACISHVISVGAVFDANLGTLGFCVEPESCAPNQGTHASCTPRPIAWTYSTPPDRETPYSNTASFLDFLAPSHNAYTTAKGGGYRSDFGGTSAACPYAAGAAAVLQSAAKAINGAWLAPSEVRSILAATGDPVTDVKQNYGKRRVNLENAVNSLSAQPVPSFDWPVCCFIVLLLSIRFRQRSMKA